mmetsp:Transcript_6520/g.24487  ORF Transcript_6520/g.24487 Transcript_6520/m.24487 type:complete len:227 (-) Transcript_6520:305-985(-)
MPISSDNEGLTVICQSETLAIQIFSMRNVHSLNLVDTGLIVWEYHSIRTQWRNHAKVSRTIEDRQMCGNNNVLGFDACPTFARNSVRTRDTTDVGDTSIFKDSSPLLDERLCETDAVGISIELSLVRNFDSSIVLKLEPWQLSRLHPASFESCLVARLHLLLQHAHILLLDGEGVIVLMREVTVDAITLNVVLYILNSLYVHLPINACPLCIEAAHKSRILQRVFS